MKKKNHFTYSSLVMRDLTLRSAQSFGSFHLIRLLFDEYIFYLVEQRIAKTTHTTPLQMLGEVCYNIIIIIIHIKLQFDLIIILIY